jgi:cardiolipin synthase A/B
MNWLLLAEITYIILLVLVCIWVIYETRSTAKAICYLLLVIFLPIIGIFIYFSFGTNYRKRKIYNKKLLKDEALISKVREKLSDYSKDQFLQGGDVIARFKELAYMLARDSSSILTSGNRVSLLLNGEKKFDEVIRCISEAKRHIHIEYYIYEDDEIGGTIERLLIKKAAEGVAVRFIYDDFGSRPIRRKLVKRLRTGGVPAFPFHKVLLWAFANRLNYRNHRKIIVIDGTVGFVGGVNVSDKYINSPGTKNVFWRDTHLKIEGAGVLELQHIFLSDWNFCANDDIVPDSDYFPNPITSAIQGSQLVQIASSGPDSDRPTVLYAILQAINLATTEILITTPYFIPGESITDALIVAALGGVKVQLLVPGISDSRIVNAAAHSYYDDLLAAGVEIFLYQKGFVHAKTIVADRMMSMVGTANMDYRSFELNFEVNAIVYDRQLADELAAAFQDDLENSIKINPVEWQNRPVSTFLLEKTARLMSPIL